MEVSTALLLRTPLFRGIPQEALPALLEGLGARKRRCGRGEVVLRRGERADRLGLVLSGTLHIVKEDFWGSRTIVGLSRGHAARARGARRLVCGGLCLSGR